jgi:hypothetical protein
MEIKEFIKENKNLISRELGRKGFIFNEGDFEKIMVGMDEILYGRDKICKLVENKNVASLGCRKNLKNHTLPYRWVNIDFSFYKKRYELKINGKIIYYNYCIL